MSEEIATKEPVGRIRFEGLVGGRDDILEAYLVAGDGIDKVLEAFSKAVKLYLDTGTKEDMGCEKPSKSLEQSTVLI